jgi:iron(III) transport system permease protein
LKLLGGSPLRLATTTVSAWPGKVLGRVGFERLVLFSLAALLPALIVFLLGITFWISFVEGIPGSEIAYTLAHYVAVYQDPFTYNALLNTLGFALTTVAVALTFGLPIAWLTERTDMPGKSVVYTLMVISLVVPTFFVAMGWLLLLHPRIGFLNAWIAGATGSDAFIIDISTIAGMGFVEGISLAPLAFVITAASFKAIDPALEEAAFVHSMGRMATIFNVTLPLVFPSTLAAAIYIFVIGLSAFDVPAVIGLGRRVYTLSTLIYVTALSPEQAAKYGIPAAVGALMFVIAIVVTWWYTRVLRVARKYEVVGGKSYRVKTFALGRSSIFCWLLCGCFFVLNIGLPLLLVAWSSLLPYVQPPSWKALELLSLKQFWNVPWDLVVRGSINTLVLMGAVPTIIMALCVPIAWVILRSGSRVRYIYEFLVFLPHAMPSIIFGVAALVASLFVVGDLIPLYGTVWIIATVYIVERVTFGSRVVNGAMIQVHRELEEVGYVTGLSVTIVLTRVLVPLLRAALFNGWLWLALITFRELTVAALLASPTNITLPVVIWNLLQGGSLQQAAAVTIVMMAILTPLVLLYWYVGGRRVFSW